MAYSSRGKRKTSTSRRSSARRTNSRSSSRRYSARPARRSAGSNRRRSTGQTLRLVIEQVAPQAQNLLDPFNAKVEKSIGKARF